jgi:glycosyltransferase involved in cell wall biosynthesis
MIFLYLSLFFLINLNLYSVLQFVILTTSYNNKDYYKKNLTELFKQTHTDWVCYFVDDKSDDSTYELAYDYAKSCSMLDKMIFIKNEKNLGALENQYHVISKCDDHQIIVIYDGDDWFLDPGVLDYVAQIYQDQNVWLTYGSYATVTTNFPMVCRDVSCEKNINDKFFFVSIHGVFRI